MYSHHSVLIDRWTGTREEKWDMLRNWGSLKCCYDDCRVFGLMFALDAKRRQLEGEDNPASCWVLLSWNAAPSWPRVRICLWWMHFQHYIFTCDEAISLWRKAHSRAVTQVLVQLSPVSSEALSAQSHQLISVTGAASCRHRSNYSFNNEMPAHQTIISVKKSQSKNTALRGLSDVDGWGHFVVAGKKN